MTSLFIPMKLCERIYAFIFNLWFEYLGNRHLAKVDILALDVALLTIFMRDVMRKYRSGDCTSYEYSMAPHIASRITDIYLRRTASRNNFSYVKYSYWNTKSSLQRIWRNDRCILINVDYSKRISSLEFDLLRNYNKEWRDLAPIDQAGGN